MTVNATQHLKAFIEAVVKKTVAGAGAPSIQIGSMLGTSAADEALSLECGAGYHQPHEVLVRFPGNDLRRMTPEQAACEFVAFYGLD